MIRAGFFLFFIAIAACATGITADETSVDDDFSDGGASSGGGSVGGSTNVGAGTSAGGSGGTTSAGGNGGTTSSGGSPPTGVWINEIHYDNESTDTGEGVELAGTAGTDLSTYDVVLYNQLGETYSTPIAANGTILDQQNGFGAIWFTKASIQNGPGDGIALVDGTTVVQFLSYGGVVTAVDGPAAGMTSTDIGVAESSSTPTGQSLQLTGTGNSYASFTWTGPTAASTGQINAGQTMQ